jgi:hypothetical protein
MAIARPVPSGSSLGLMSPLLLVLFLLPERRAKAALHVSAATVSSGVSEQKSEKKPNDSRSRAEIAQLAGSWRPLGRDAQSSTSAAPEGSVRTPSCGIRGEHVTLQEKRSVSTRSATNRGWCLRRRELFAAAQVRFVWPAATRKEELSYQTAEHRRWSFRRARRDSRHCLNLHNAQTEASRNRQ